MIRAHAAAALLALGSALPGAAQEPEEGEFTLVRAGAVVATETFSRSAARLQTELAIPGQVTFRTRASLHPDATVGRVEIRLYRAGDGTAEPARASAVLFRDGGVVLEDPIGSPVAPPVRADSGAVPYLNPSPSYMEQIVRRGRAIGGDTVAVPIWTPAPGGGELLSGTLTFDENAATLVVAGVAIEIATDAVGRLLAARVPSQALVIERR